MPPINLTYWRLRLAVQAHSGSPHVGLTTAQFAEILDELEAGQAEATEQRAIADQYRQEVGKLRRAIDAAWARTQATLAADTEGGQ